MIKGYHQGRYYSQVEGAGGGGRRQWGIGQVWVVEGVLEQHINMHRCSIGLDQIPELEGDDKRISPR